MLVEGRHFFADTNPYRLGHKVCAVNLSDIAAMGATPRFMTLAMGIPSADSVWLEAFSQGFLDLASKYDVELIGGDTTRSACRTFSVTIMGEIPYGTALCRHHAQIGDDIWVSGQLGLAALGLQGLLNNITIPKTEHLHLQEALEAPMPRVALGLQLRSYAHACMDISDGLLGDLPHILKASQVGAQIEWEQLPTSPLLHQFIYQGSPHEKQIALQAMLGGGDDYELLFTAHPSQATKIVETSTQCHVPVTRIGYITEEQILKIVDNNGLDLNLTGLAYQGFNHFS
jgi:thiamine-monophosphate kinase